MHQKILSAIKTYPMKRKIKQRFIVSPRPGPHSKDSCIPLLVLVRDILKYAKTAKEAKKIIKLGKVLIDEKIRKDVKCPIGIFDSVRIPESNDCLRIIAGEKWLEVIKIPKSETGLKLCRIENKKILKGGKTQLNLNDGKNILVKKDNYNVGDSLLLSLPKLEIKNHLKRKVGSLCVIIGGQNKGKIAAIKDFKEIKSSNPNLVSIKVGDKKINLPEKLIFVIGDKTPAIKVSEK